ncbi:hypothetical protein GQ42DRAFT_26972 [Ramicandelaber brevisporus]|nr:hypothetical protein GQ42DRAFT_26972 [Ramicandelaber brevisporus]
MVNRLPTYPASSWLFCLFDSLFSSHHKDSLALLLSSSVLNSTQQTHAFNHTTLYSLRRYHQGLSKSSAVVARSFRSLSVYLVTRSTRSSRRSVSRSLLRLKTAVQGVRRQAR